MLRNIIFGYAGSEDCYNIFLRYALGDLVILRDFQMDNGENIIHSEILRFYEFDKKVPKEISHIDLVKITT